MTRNFRRILAYRKWLAWRHIHGAFARTRGNQNGKIRGFAHKVEHRL